MEIIKNYPSDVYSMIKVPSDDAVTSGINKVYPYLSAEKREKLIIFMFSQIPLILLSSSQSDTK